MGEFTGSIVTLLIIGVVLGVMAVGASSNTKTYQCTITGRERDGPFGGHFYDLSCIGGITFSNIAGGQPYACARIGDNVTVTTYGGWWVDQITGDSSC